MLNFHCLLKGSLFWACHLLHLLQGQHFPRLLWLHTSNCWALLLPHRNGIYFIFAFNYWRDTCLNLVYLAAETDLGEIHLHPSSPGWKVVRWQIHSTLDPFLSRDDGRNKPGYNGFWLQPWEGRDYWDQTRLEASLLQPPNSNCSGDSWELHRDHSCSNAPAGKTHLRITSSLTNLIKASILSYLIRLTAFLQSWQY